jgi:hypothetical protein
VINAENSSDPFYHKLRKILGIFMICKASGLFILYAIQAALYFAFQLWHVMAACVVLVVIVVVIIISLFVWLSVKVNGILDKHPTLSIVRTKVYFE